MRPAGHAAALGCAVPVAERPAAEQLAAAGDCSGSAAWPAVAAAVSVGPAAEHVVVAAAVLVGSVAGHADAAAAVLVGPAVEHAAVAAAVSVGSAAGHAAVAVAASAPAWLPLVRAVRTQGQEFRETETELPFRDLQMLSLVLPQLQE